MNKALAIKVIMDWRTTPAHEFRTRLGSNNITSF